MILLLTIAVAACGGGGSQGSSNQKTVPLQVVQGAGGSVVALVPVYINDQGPYYFTLDTGASTSAIDTQLVDQLGLQVVGRPQQVTGITGSTTARLVRVDKWRVGDVQLPAANVTDLDLPEGAGQVGMRGLLGSDMLSQFGTVTVDYDHKQLILQSRSS